MKAIIYSFRNEYHLSGQYRATSQMMELFKELGWETERPENHFSGLHTSHQFNFKLLYLNLKRPFNGCSILNRSNADLVIIHIPCLSQLLLIRFFYSK